MVEIALTVVIASNSTHCNLGGSEQIGESSPLRR
jgi:hypothetical protein